MKVEYFKHTLGKAERASFEKASRSWHLTTGETVAAFEKAFALKVGLPYAVGLTSGTGALHLALLAAGVGEGDEVITTPLSFVATSHAVLMAGATPVFVDVESDTGNIDASLIEAAITPRTKAILPVHLYGQMADMKRIAAIAKKHKLVVIEDAAHAVEAARDGIRPGERSFGACFSFYATKSLTSGEGGAFATKDARVARTVKELRLHGVTKELAERDKTTLGMYDVVSLGWKYNMDNLQAALLLPQLKTLIRNHRSRAKVAKAYEKGLRGLSLTLPTTRAGVTHAHHLFPIWVEPKKRNAIAMRLKQKGIGISVNNYPPIHLLSYYRKRFGYTPGMFPIAERIGASVISLPIYATLTQKEIAYVVREVSAAVSS